MLGKRGTRDDIEGVDSEDDLPSTSKKSRIDEEDKENGYPVCYRY